MEELENLISEIVDCAIEVRRHLGAGFLEVVYQNALYYELKQHGISVEKEFPLTVQYKDIVVGEYRADLVVNNSVIIEIKSVKELNVNHELQLVNYLTATGIESGILINFGSEKIQIKRKYKTYKRTNGSF